MSLNILISPPPSRYFSMIPRWCYDDNDDDVCRWRWNRLIHYLFVYRAHYQMGNITEMSWHYNSMIDELDSMSYLVSSNHMYVHCVFDYRIATCRCQYCVQLADSLLLLLLCKSSLYIIRINKWIKYSRTSKQLRWKGDTQHHYLHSLVRIIIQISK
jgi:hypothetical protein